jgi:protein-disulfide isomerase
MKNAVVIGTLGVALSFAMLAFGYVAGTATTPATASPSPRMAAAGEPLDRAAVEAIVHEYLVANPDVMLEVQAALEAREEEGRRVSQIETIQNSSDLIFNASYDGVIGNPEGKVTIVEFFDYNCGYCKRALGDMEKLVANDPDLRFVVKEFPILGPDSQKASQVSMAFHTLMPSKYAEFHTALLNAPGRANEATAIRVALSLGADEAALREEMKNPAIGAAFGETYELANRLAITGTPSYVIGEEVVFGALGHQVLAQKIDEARAACAGTSC